MIYTHIHTFIILVYLLSYYLHFTLNCLSVNIDLKRLSTLILRVLRGTPYKETLTITNITDM